MLEATVYLDVNQDFYHTSYVYTGLLQLASKGKLALEFRSPNKSGMSPANRSNLCVSLDLVVPGSKPKAICFDLRDKSSRFCDEALANCDLYYMRSYFQGDLENLPPHLRRKVVPFGMNYACSTAAMMPILLRAGIRQWPLAKLPELLKVGFDYWRLRRPEDYAWQPRQPKEPVVLFQTRVWEDREVGGDDAEAINEERASIVKSLRSAFGAQFVGGLVPNNLARTRYPGLLTNMPSDPHSYTHLNKKALIGVYTRGLHHSTAWKLGEYFAASMCVVAGTIRNKLPVPLEEGKQFLLYRSGDEAVSACEKILSSHGLQQSMRSAAYNYYQNYIDPSAHISWCLENAITIK